MNIKENFKNLMEKADRFTMKQLETMKYVGFFIIVADLFGIYYFLKLKALAILILVLSMVYLSAILYLISRKPPRPLSKEELDSKNKYKEVKDNMTIDFLEPQTEEESEKEEVKEKKEEKEESEEENPLDFLSGSGLPSAEDYDKRLNDAIGF